MRAVGAERYRGRLVWIAVEGEPDEPVRAPVPQSHAPEPVMPSVELVLARGREPCAVRGDGDIPEVIHTVDVGAKGSRPRGGEMAECGQVTE